MQKLDRQTDQGVRPGKRKTPQLRGFPVAGAGFEPATFGL
jgi:hypothetical protein